jgi:hypothetical protein
MTAAGGTLARSSDDERTAWRWSDAYLTCDSTACGFVQLVALHRSLSFAVTCLLQNCIPHLANGLISIGEAKLPELL